MGVCKYPWRDGTNLKLIIVSDWERDKCPQDTESTDSGKEAHPDGRSRKGARLSIRVENPFGQAGDPGERTLASGKGFGISPGF
jgi:hypothetical protein